MEERKTSSGLTQEIGKTLRLALRQWWWGAGIMVVFAVWVIDRGYHRQILEFLAPVTELIRAVIPG